MATTINGFLPRRFYNAGNPQIVEAAIPDDVVEYHIAIERDNWPDIGSPVLSAKFWLSYDNGQTWQKPGGFATPGGNYIHRLGFTVFFTTITVRIRPGVNRRIRCQIETFARIRLQGSITMLTQSEATIRMPGEERQ